LPETRQKLYNAASIAGVIVGLARYIIAHHDQFSTSAIGATDATRQALELLTRRPPRPRGSTKGRTTVRWERIERELRKGTHRFLGYRCPNGEFAALVLVRFCIACERSRLTTRELCVRTGLRSHRLGSWLNGRVLPDFSMLEQLQNALERLEGRAADPTPASAESSAALVATRAAHRAPPEPAAPVPTDGAADILVGMASTARGLRAMYRAGWRPDGTSREHLIAVAQTAMEVGGLTHADLTSKATVSVADASAPAFRAVLDAFSPPRRGRRKGDRKEE